MIVNTYSVQNAIKEGRKNNKNILLLDTSDTTGGGSSGDSVNLLKELIKYLYT